MPSKEQIESNKNEIITLLRTTRRAGIEEVIKYLNKSNFFYIWSSMNRHHNWCGGLAQHCLGVYKIAQKQSEGLSRDSVIIAAMLHDICKAGMLKFDNQEEITKRRIHIPGHGSRSVKLLETVCHFKLTDDERRAIRWHMGGKHAPDYAQHDVEMAHQSKLWQIIHAADHQDAALGKNIITAVKSSNKHLKLLEVKHWCLIYYIFFLPFF